MHQKKQIARKLFSLCLLYAFFSWIVVGIVIQKKELIFPLNAVIKELKNIRDTRGRS